MVMVRPALIALAFAAVSQAASEIQRGNLVVTTPALEISFEGYNVRYLKNVETGEVYIANPGPGWIDLNIQQPTGQALTPSAWTIGPDPATGGTIAELRATDSVRTVLIQVGEAENGEVFFRLAGTATKPGTRSILWGIQGFNSGGQFLFPGQAGIAFNSRSPRDFLALEYPTHWEGQFAIYESEKGGLLMYARDPKPQFKRVQASRQYGSLDIAFEVFAIAPWSRATDPPVVEWRLKPFAGAWRKGVDAYREWAVTALPQSPPRPELDWVKQIEAVIVIIDKRDEYLAKLAEKLIPEKTLLYLVNWRSDPYDVNYPNYQPADGVAEFTAKAHEMGFRVMLHSSALGVAQYNEHYEAMRPYHLKQPDDESLIFWPFGLWPGGSPPPDYLPSFGFISPAASAYRELYFNSIGAAIEKVKPDVIHLDAGGVLMNDANGEIEGRNSIDGMVQFHREFAQRFPQIALSYESITETLLPFQNFAQRWNADFEAHPIGTYFHGDQIRFYGFLDQENPDEAGFIRYIKRYESQGIMPTIRLLSLDDLDGETHPVAERIFRLMRLHQEHQLRPDWDGDWTGLQFRFKSEDGAVESTVEDLGEQVRVKVGEETVYERVRNTQTVETPLAIDNWAAFDGERLLGLDPEQEYWLGLHQKDLSEKPILKAIPSFTRLGEATFTTPKYAFFELARVERPGYDFISNFRTARLGVLYGTRDLPLAGGAISLMTRTLVGGNLVTPSVIVIPPSQLMNAAAFFEYEVEVPQGDDVRFQFEVGLSDFGRRSDGALVAVWINGTSAWRQEIKLGPITPVSIDLDAYRGQKIKLRMLTHGGPRFNVLDDVVAWSNLRMRVAEQASGETVVQLPSGAEDPTVTGEGVRTSETEGGLKLDTSLPVRFAVFAEPPPRIELGGSLLDLPRHIWERPYEGYLRPARLSERDEVQPVISGGERSERAIALIPATKSVKVATFAVHLPEAAREFEFRTGFADATPPLPLDIDYSGVLARVKINGEEVWSSEFRTRGWKPGTVELTKWAGKNVIVQLETDSLSNSIFDFAYWDTLIVR
jgi:hypothetical protein